jgi:hypothetical protein
LLVAKIAKAARRLQAALYPTLHIPLVEVQT